MSHAYNPESDTIAMIERLELEAREIRRKIDQTGNEEDQRVLRRQLKELEDPVGFLRKKLP